MKIAFLCSSLEPGRDGVGDYTAGFAAELRLRGHDVIVIALSDKFANEVISASHQVEGGSIQTLRLPSRLSWLERIHCAGNQLDCFDPEWVSLQFVCYGFHPKGLVHGFAGKLTPLLKGRKLHIMFHEIWLCKELGFGWKQCAVGALQRFLIQRFVRAAKPDVMHTSNNTYVALLNRSGIPVTELRLFGNAPVLDALESKWIVSQLRAVLGNQYQRKDIWSFGFFGGLHAQWPPEPLLTHLHRAATAAGKRPVLLSIGRIGQVGAELWNRMAEDYRDRLDFVRLGEQPAERISEYLSWLDFGIATTPRAILGKSGTVVSMLEHGLPVIVNRNDASFVGSEPRDSEPLLIPCDVNLEARLRVGIARGPRGSRRPEVARAFTQSLEQASTSQVHQY